MLPFNFDVRFLSPDFNIQYISGHTEGQLVWFEHPAQNPLTANWRSHVISSTDADTFFAITSLPTPDGDIKCIITAGFFADSLAIFWSNDGRWDHGHVSKDVGVHELASHLGLVRMESEIINVYEII